MIQIPELICEEDLTQLWAHAFMKVFETPATRTGPLVMTLNHFESSEPVEDVTFRRTLDKELKARGCPSTGDSAFTIFPRDVWLRKGGDRVALYEYYLTFLYPRLRKLSLKNRYGTYFQRMIDYSGVHKIDYAGLHEGTFRKVNQLEFVITEWCKRLGKGQGIRESALQLGCLDPVKDHTGQALRGFPCLQQVSFAKRERDGLIVSAYYPIQYIFDRAYGNLLGLCHLGAYVAQATGLNLQQLNVFVANPTLFGRKKGITKTGLKEFADSVRFVFASGC